MLFAHFAVWAQRALTRPQQKNFPPHIAEETDLVVPGPQLASGQTARPCLRPPPGGAQSLSRVLRPLLNQKVAQSPILPTEGRAYVRRVRPCQWFRRAKRCAFRRFSSLQTALWV